MEKSRKINEVINKYGYTLNLHEIKAKTGAGNGYKHIDKVNMSTTINNDTDKTYTHKSHKINDLIINTSKKLNLHEIKAQTGAGSGYKH
ncbi:hypothetical protein [Clostridium disporicum]|mgnify:CR=1 FL=1|uniref:hypothetical protein n=1 Tax=Clostridium disporicum TaxID=84024 RepID=UPI00361EE058